MSIIGHISPAPLSACALHDTGIELHNLPMARGNNQSIERAARTIRKINDGQNEIFIGVRMLLWGK